MMRRGILVLFLLVFVPCFAWAEDYGALLERGEFFLAKGASYLPDAVRALEGVGELDPVRAGGDVRFVTAISRAYLGVSRLTEAYSWILALDRSGVKDKNVDAMRDHLLNEAGVGRLRLVSRLPAFGVTASLRPEADARLDGAGKRVLEKLNQFLQRPFSVGREGVTLLVPEGKLVFSSSVPLAAGGVFSRGLEIFAGDEVEQLLVAGWPLPDQWRVVSGNRSVAFSWPRAERAAGFRLSRRVGDAPPVVLYEGVEPSFIDRSALPGVPAVYELATLGEGGLLVGLSSFTSTAKPPVGSISAKAHLNNELNVVLDWELGDGSLDRLVIKKSERGEERIIVDQRGEEIVRSGEITDGPILPSPGPQSISYSVIAVVEGEAQSAEAKVLVSIPAETGRIDSVREKFTPDMVYVEWETFPRDGVAEGYHIFLMRESQGMGELVGTVRDAFARDFSYVPKTLEQPTARWKHKVVPFVGKRFLVDLVPISASDKVPDVEFSRRVRRLSKLPSMILSWEAFPGVGRYLVRVAGKKEFLVRENYVELSGLQQNFSDTPGDVKVFALTGDGSLILLLNIGLDYKRYKFDGLSGSEQ